MEFFFEQNLPLNNSKIACIGPGTKRTLAKYTQKIEFIGNEVDTNKTGKLFAQLIGNETCLFPISNISKRSIQKHLPKNQCFDVVIYKTCPKVLKLTQKLDVLIFTSPSNVESYFANNVITPAQKVIAMGPSTAKELAQFNIKEIIIPEIAGELGLLDCLL